MARRILFVEKSGFRDPDKELCVDFWVEVEWKMQMIVEDMTGDMSLAPPTYKVRPIETYPTKVNEYGTISDPEETAWLSKAMTKPPGDYSYAAIAIVARVNELQAKNSDGRFGFKIEVLTGRDAESLMAAEKRDNLIRFAKEHWWQIGLGLLAAWWWIS